MDVVNFTKLEDLAHRGPVVRGDRYVVCHNKTPERCGDMGRYDWDTGNYEPERPANHANLTVAVSGIEYLSYNEIDVRMGREPFWTAERLADAPDSRAHVKQPVWFDLYTSLWGSGKSVLWMSHYAADCGLFEVEGVDYKNETNYLLDYNALLRRGIRVDLTPVEY